MLLSEDCLDLENVLYADGFEEAFLGHIQIFNNVIACYDANKCLDCLIKQGMEPEEALEYFNFNVQGAYVGDQTPAFLYVKN
jgi:hypothetical protein